MDQEVVGEEWGWVLGTNRMFVYFLDIGEGSI